MPRSQITCLDKYNICVYADDLVIFGHNKEVLQQRLSLYLKKAEQLHLTLSNKKAKFAATVVFIGYNL